MSTNYINTRAVQMDIIESLHGIEEALERMNVGPDSQLDVCIQDIWSVLGAMQVAHEAEDQQWDEMDDSLGHPFESHG